MNRRDDKFSLPDLYSMTLSLDATEGHTLASPFDRTNLLLCHYGGNRLLLGIYVSNCVRIDDDRYLRSITGPTHQNNYSIIQLVSIKYDVINKLNLTESEGALNTSRASIGWMANINSRSKGNAKQH